MRVVLVLEIKVATLNRQSQTVTPHLLRGLVQVTPVFMLALTILSQGLRMAGRIAQQVRDDNLLVV